MEEGPESKRWSVWLKNWRNGEGLKNCGKNAKMKYFQKLRDLRYVKVATDRRQSRSHFAQDGPILPKLVSMAA